MANIVWTACLGQRKCAPTPALRSTGIRRRQSGYQGDRKLCELCCLLGKAMVVRGQERVTSVFGQGEDWIVNAQLWVKLKLPARRQERQKKLAAGPESSAVLGARAEGHRAPMSSSLARAFTSLTEVRKLCPEDLLDKEVGERKGNSSPATHLFYGHKLRIWGTPNPVFPRLAQKSFPFLRM